MFFQGLELLWGRDFSGQEHTGSLEQTRMSLVVESSAVPPSGPIIGEGPSMAGSHGCGDLE